MLNLALPGRLRQPHLTDIPTITQGADSRVAIRDFPARFSQLSSADEAHRSDYWKGNVDNSMRTPLAMLGVREGRRQFQLRPHRLTPRVRRLKVLRPPPHHLGAADDARLLSGETGAAPIPSRSALLRRGEFAKFRGPRLRTLSPPTAWIGLRSGAAPGLSVGFFELARSPARRN